MMVWNRLIIEGNAVYEIDEECARQKQRNEQKRAKGFQNCRYGGGPRRTKGSAER